MSTQGLPYKLITIEGNIGAGKTTLCEMLAKEWSAQLVLEAFTDNPFLQNFYAQPERYAFPVELFFLTERHKQWEQHKKNSSLFQSMTLSDYMFAKTILFAKNNLSEDEFRLFRRFYNILDSHIPNPEIIVYLYRTVSDLQHNIRQRSRSYEQDIKDEYLQNLQNVYLSYLKSIEDIPVIILDVDQVYFWHEPKAFGQIKAILEQKYLPGIHYKSIATNSSLLF